MSTPIKEIVCPNCGKPYIYEARRWKDEVICGNCNAVITVDDSTNMLPPVAGNASGVANPAATHSQPGYSASAPLPPHLMNAGMAVDPQAPVGAQAALPANVLPPTADAPSANFAPAANVLPPTAMGTPPVARNTPTALDRLASRRGSNLNGIIAAVLIVVGLLVVAAFAIGTGSVIMNQPVKGTTEKQGPGEKVNGKEIHWALAPKEASKVQQMQIRIPLVQFGEIRGKDATRQVLTSSGSSYLQIFVELRNRGASGTPYVSWYGNEFQDGDQNRIAKLVDQDGAQLDMMIFEDVAMVQGHTARAMLNENERMEDVLIFELPEGRDLDSIKSLYLSLPAQAFDANGTAHFEIPRSIIKTLTDRPDSGLLGSPLDGGKEEPAKDN